MKKVRVKFVDFTKNKFREEHILKVLRNKYDVEISDTPEYLFFSVFSEDNLKYENAVRIFITTENLAPDFNMCDYAIGFEYMDYEDRYLRFPISYFDGYNQMQRLCESKHVNIGGGG